MRMKLQVCWIFLTSMFYNNKKLLLLCLCNCLKEGANVRGSVGSACTAFLWHCALPDAKQILSSYCIQRCNLIFNFLSIRCLQEKIMIEPQFNYVSWMLLFSLFFFPYNLWSAVSWPKSFQGRCTPLDVFLRGGFLFHLIREAPLAAGSTMTPTLAYTQSSWSLVQIRQDPWLVSKDIFEHWGW